jgi:hypothetical protein
VIKNKKEALNRTNHPRRGESAVMDSCTQPASVGSIIPEVRAD